MSVQAQDEAAFVDRVYDAAIDPEAWIDVLARFADLTGGDGAALILQNQESGEGAGLTARLDPAAPELYFGHFATRNPVQHIENPREAVRTFTPLVLTDEDRLPKQELMKTEYYNDFMRRFDMHSFLMIGLAVDGLDAATINVTKPERRGSFTDAQIGLAQRLHPHFIRAFALSRRFAEAGGIHGQLADVLDRSPHGLILLADDGRVVHLNRAARCLTAGPDGLRIVCGRLVASAPDEARRLAVLIGSAAGKDAAERNGGDMAITCAARRLPLSVGVTPVRPGGLAVFHRGRAVLVRVTDLEAEISLPERTLGDLFGLSRAETRVALALFEGQDPRQAAASLGLSFHTVRGHLARIFDKTQTHGQVELARLMMRLVGADQV